MTYLINVGSFFNQDCCYLTLRNIRTQTILKEIKDVLVFEIKVLYSKFINDFVIYVVFFDIAIPSMILILTSGSLSLRGVILME